MVKVKICGITNLQDALNAQNAGADALGFIFYNKSKRNISVSKATEISKQLNPFISKVGVFVNESQDNIQHIVSHCRLTHVQLHGDETIEFAKSLNCNIIRALNFSSELEVSIKEWSNFQLLIDSGDAENFGGTGKAFSWHAAKTIVDKKKVILAGGLNIENVNEAISFCNPIAVDISSGVEKEPGIKDPLLVKQFINIVKNI